MASFIAFAAWATSAMAAPYHLPGTGEDFRPPAPASLPAGYDPYRRPVPDRMPDGYADARPYWFPAPVASTPWVQTPAGYVVQPLWSAEFGARYFGSTGETLSDNFATPPPFTNFLVSRLTYRDLVAHSGEIFGRFDHGTGLFVKGFAGGGVIPGGTLQDEDFPPFIFPYSSTNSELRSGSLGYGAIDFGWAWTNPSFRLSFYAGYFQYYELLRAFGCVQTAGNPFICAPGDVGPSTEGIRQQTRLYAARLGFGTEWRFADSWKLTTDLAWLPYVYIDGRDDHLLRQIVFIQKGAEAFTLQLEAILSYALTGGFWVGIGARYWNLLGTTGNAPLSVADDPFEFSASLKTERWGAFIQGSYKFGRWEP